MKAGLSRFQYTMPAVSILLLDQATKAWIRQHPQGCVLLQIPDAVEITHDVNTGAAFSMLSGHTPVIGLLSVVLIAALAVYLCRAMHMTHRAMLCLSALLGGGLGNLLDRILFGGVTDFIRLCFVRFPVFNVADIAITFSVGMLALDLLRGKLDPIPKEEHHGSDHRINCRR